MIVIASLCVAMAASRVATAQTALPSLLAAHHTQAKLILSADTAKPGATIWAGVDLKMEPGWHTYWKNPGAAGMATKIEWQLPPGITAGDIEWPLPDKFPPVEVTTYGYEKEVVLLVPLTLASNLPDGPLDLKANVSWLECKDVCIPADQNVDATLNIGSETKPSADSAAIEVWRQKIPQLAEDWTLHAWWEKPENGDTRPLIISGSFTGTPTGNAVTNFDFFPAASDNYEIQAATTNISLGNTEFAFEKMVRKFSKGWPKEISGVLVSERADARLGNVVRLAVADKAPAGETILENSAGVPSPSSNPPQPQAGGTTALPLMLLYAFIGGLILNVMPCVLPVIALKILGFVSEARSEPRHVRNLGLIYALGVLVSFLALAGIAIGVKAAGHRAGWGMQFGNPIFIVCLTTLVALIALNLFGVFEVVPNGKAMDAAERLASRHGAPGAFFNGLLATTLATPCTAPYLSYALGFAFSQPPLVLALIFLFVGAGLAAPYVLLSCNPSLLKFLPKPGPWMGYFKIAMGFPMLMTVFWLLSIAYETYGGRTLWLGIFLVILSAAAWIFGEFFQRGRRHRNLALGIVLFLVVGGYSYALEDQLQWRKPQPAADVGVASEDIPGGIHWEAWSPQAVAQARAAGHPVLVDFTADWCLTCQVNKKISIEIPSVRQKLKEINAVALVGDYTRFPENITEELNRYQRAGVPLVLVFPKDPDAQAIVLPEVLTPGIVLDALDRAAH